MYVYCNTEECLCNHFCHGKVISITYSECVSEALVIQHVVLYMRHIILTSVACLVLPYFSIYVTNGMVFRKELLNIKMCFDFIYNFCLKNFSF